MYLIYSLIINQNIHNVVFLCCLTTLPTDRNLHYNARCLIGKVAAFKLLWFINWWLSVNVRSYQIRAHQGRKVTDCVQGEITQLNDHIRLFLLRSTGMCFFAAVRQWRWPTSHHFTMQDSTTSPETLSPGGEKWLRKVLWENVLLNTKQNWRTPSTAWKGCRYDHWGKRVTRWPKRRERYNELAALSLLKLSSSRWDSNWNKQGHWDTLFLLVSDCDCFPCSAFI